MCHETKVLLSCGAADARRSCGKHFWPFSAAPSAARTGTEMTRFAVRTFRWNPSKKITGVALRREIAILPRPTVLTSDIESWLDAFCEAFLGAVPETDRGAARAETVELLRPVLQAEDGRWILDYVRLRFRATLPAIL